MDDMLSLASGIVILSIILCGTGLLLKRNFSIVWAFLAYTALSVILILLDLAAYPLPDGGFPYAYIVFLAPVLILYKEALPVKLFVFSTQLFSACAIISLSFLISDAILPEPGVIHNIVQLIGIALLGSAYLYWTKRSGLHRGFFTQKSGWEWALFAFGPCLATVLLPCMFTANAHQNPMVSSLMLLFAMWSVAVLIFAVLSSCARIQTEHDLMMARRVLEAEAEQADDLAKMMEASRVLRHDCKHHLHVAQILLETGKIEEARAYLLSFGVKCDEGVLPQFCANPAVNALLVGYHRKCKEASIDFSAMLDLPEDPPMDSFELCTLFGNLLENALEACQKAPEGQRRITLRGAPQGGQLLITVRNTFDGTVLKEEDHIISRKGSCGGLGIKSIRAIASRHSGEYLPTWEGQTFTASVVLRMQPHKVYTPIA